MPPYTLVESKIANFAHYRRVNGQETDAYSSSWKQKGAIASFVLGSDVLVILPTGYGQSLCFALLPLLLLFCY